MEVCDPDVDRVLLHLVGFLVWKVYSFSKLEDFISC